MKKVLLGAVVLGGLALTSCKKDYVCELGGPETPDATYNDLDKDEADEAKKACETVGGSWSTK